MPNTIGSYTSDEYVAATVTVDESVTNNYIPVNGSFADHESKSQFIISAADLQYMLGMHINGMTFYAQTTSVDWGNAQFDVCLSEVGETTLSTLADWTALNRVYAGKLSINKGQMQITFDDPYLYQGGNLLVDINQTAPGSIKSCTWIGTLATGASLGGYDTTIEQRNFLPYTTFDYSEPNNVAKPAGLTVTLTPGDGTVATLSWTEKGTATAWEICLNNNEAHPIVANMNPFTLTGLTPETKYTAKVRAVNGDEKSMWSTAITFTPTDAYFVIVNDGKVLNDYVPVYGMYVDETSMSQFILPAADLTAMKWGTVNKLTFYAAQSSVNWGDAKFEVYMANVANTTFSSGTPVWDGMEKVMNEGSLSIIDNQMVITLDEPFQYTDGSLMIGIKETVSGSWQKSSWYGVNTTENTAIGNEDQEGDSYETKTFLPKTTLEFVPGIAPICPRPTGLALVGEPTYNSAQLSWTPGDEGQGAWQLCVNGDEDNLIDVTENPYTLTSLSEDTEYTVKVRAVDGSDVSAWSNEVTFTTPEQYAMPTELAARNVTSSSATISWTGSADSYNLRYRTAEETVVFSDGFESGLGQWTIIRNDGGSNNTDWRQFNPNNFDTPFSAYDGDYVAMSRSWSSGAYSVDNWLISPQVALGGIMRFWARDDGSYHEHYDVYVSTTTNDIGAFTKVFEPGDASSTWTEVTVDLSAFAGKNGYVAFRHTDVDQNYLLIDDVTITVFTPTSDWTTVNDVTNPYTLSGLAGSTYYQVEVQGVYGECTSNWSNIGFYTPESNPVPTDVEADLAADGATITWTGFGDSYNVQYRIAGRLGVAYFFEDFENGIPDTWTSIDADGDGNNWLALSDIGTTYPFYANLDVSDWPHSGSDAAVSPSYVNGGGSFSSNQYLISPKLDLQGTLRFYAASMDGARDSYEVLLSTTGKEAADFTTTLQTMKYAPYNSWDEVCIDLSAYAGQQGYIAIRHESEDCYFLVIDDFGIYETFATGSWQNIASVTETTATLSGLATNNAYEYRIQSVKDDNTSAWSELGEFTLLTVEDAAANTNVIKRFDDDFASVTLANRTLWRDGDWNTLVLPFDVDLTAPGCPLAGATARELSTATITGTTLTLNFSDPVDELWAGVPYIIKWDAAETNIVNPVFNGVIIDAYTYDYDNGEDDDERVRFIGTYDAVTFADEDPSILFMGTNNTLYYPDGQDATYISACRAYFKLGEDGGASLARTITAFDIEFGNDGEATGVVSLSEESKQQGEGWYMLDGRKLNGKPAVKGVYIHNGKKMVINQ